MGDVPLTDLINAALAGDSAASERAYRDLYDDLRQIAHARLRRRSRRMTLNTTALVSEAFLRFADDERLHVNDREHFFRYASTVMRSVIVDIARKRYAQKRGGNVHVVALTTDVSDNSADELEVLGVHQALDELARVDPQMVTVVELRYFAGLTEREAAEALGVSERTVRRIWRRAQLWLADALGPP